MSATLLGLGLIAQSEFEESYTSPNLADGETEDKTASPL